MRAVSAVVSGQVQGVYYRQSCRQAGRGYRLAGWVRNLTDGRVEVWAQGDPQAVDRMLEWLWAGPPGAQVTGVESNEVTPDPKLQDFLVVG